MFLIKMHWFHLFIILKKEKKLKILIKIMDIILKNLNKNISNKSFLNMTKNANSLYKKQFTNQKSYFQRHIFLEEIVRIVNMGVQNQ